MKNFRDIIKNRHEYFRALRFMYHISASCRGSILVLILLRCALAAIGVFMAVINKYIIDLATEQLNFSAGIILAILSMAISLAGGVFLNVFSVRLTEKYSCSVRAKLYEHILDSVWRARNSFHSEALLSRLTSDVSAVTGGIINISSTLVSTIFQLVTAFLLLLHYDYTLAIFAIIVGPAAAFSSILFARKIRAIQELLQQSEAEYRIYLQEQIVNADTIKAFEYERESISGLNELQNKRISLVQKKNRIQVLASACTSCVFSASYLFAFISGATKVSSGAITFGTMTAFLTLVNQVQAPIHSLARMLPQAAGVLASASRIMEITDMPEEAQTQNHRLVGAMGIQGRGVCFSYDNEKSVLSNLNFRITPGSIAAVMGQSGIGKTTLVRILLGFLTADSGIVEFFDASGKTYKCSADTRRFLSYVPQGNSLFSGTIADNLRIGKPDATLDEMEQALKDACAWDFISALPEGLNTLVGERGHGFSEGQVQRIAIARAFIRSAPILILDEATSALDEQTEQRILERINSTPASIRPTCFIISHRSSIRSYIDSLIEFEPR